jgi:hypothetical protein
MPLRSFEEELTRERRRDLPELRSRRAKQIRTDDFEVRTDARAGVRLDARDDSRGLPATS